VAVTTVFAARAKLHAEVPLHPPPLQPVKLEPVPAVEFKVTCVPEGKVSPQSVPHVTTVPPDVVPVTVPVPVPAFVMVRVKV
jgi:hypothetical protein